MLTIILSQHNNPKLQLFKMMMDLFHNRVSFLSRMCSGSTWNSPSGSTRITLQLQYELYHAHIYLTMKHEIHYVLSDWMVVQVCRLLVLLWKTLQNGNNIVVMNYKFSQVRKNCFWVFLLGKRDIQY
jgi:hypothetical protein